MHQATQTLPIAAATRVRMAVGAAHDLVRPLRDGDHMAPVEIVERLVRQVRAEFAVVYRRVDGDLLLEAAAGPAARFLPATVRVADWAELREAFAARDPAEDAFRSAAQGGGVLMAIRDERTTYGVLAIAAPARRW